MADPVNLNRFRKTKARQEAGKQAEENRVRFGRTKAEKDLAKARAAKAVRDHEGGKRDR